MMVAGAFSSLILSRLGADPLWRGAVMFTAASLGTLIFGAMLR